MKKKLIIIVICLLGLCAFAVFLSFALSDSSELHTAEISVNGEVVETIDLRTAENRTFEINTEYGSNTITVQGGEIFVSEASCPDKICVNHGPLKSEFLPIVCLPNKLVIELK